MIPIVTPDEMAAIDKAAPEPVEVLIERAGSAVARLAREMLGGTYGRRVAARATAAPARSMSTSTGSGAAASISAISAGVTTGIIGPRYRGRRQPRWTARLHRSAQEPPLQP